MHPDTGGFCDDFGRSGFLFVFAQDVLEQRLLVRARFIGGGAELAALVAFSAIKNNDRVGLIIFTRNVERFVPPTCRAFSSDSESLNKAARPASTAFSYSSSSLASTAVDSVCSGPSICS
ncbi:MAG: hypothetical protein P8X53_10480 [Chromatiales bacterium]